MSRHQLYKKCTGAAAGSYSQVHYLSTVLLQIDVTCSYLHSLPRYQSPAPCLDTGFGVRPYTERGNSGEPESTRAIAADRCAAAPIELGLMRSLDGLARDKNRPRRGVRRWPAVSPLYLETDFLNMRSIFSLMASMAVELACALPRA